LGECDVGDLLGLIGRSSVVHSKPRRSWGINSAFDTDYEIDFAYAEPVGFAESEQVAATVPGLTFYEFFAGGGMARAGLGPRWKCLFANDDDPKKATSYEDNWSRDQFLTKDVRKIELSDLPAVGPSMIWASFPCQDLSLAGMGAGLEGDRSGTFWPFWRLVRKLDAKRRGPRVIVLENVLGTLTSREGKDFEALADALTSASYRLGAMIVDAIHFVPQSRPRLFIIGVAQSVIIPHQLVGANPSGHWHPKALSAAYARLSSRTRRNWIWWKMPIPAPRNARFADFIEDNPSSVPWHTPAETAKLLNMMSHVNRQKVAVAKQSGRTVVGAIYKRTRLDEGDEKVQRAEIRFDDVAGCLRTSSGGSSRQLIMVIKGESVRSRLLSSREAARLMGLPDEYKLPRNYNEAYHLAGDGVAVPVVRHIAEHVLEPILLSNLRESDFIDNSELPRTRRFAN
jgi:DNA (cytosine-5)-methyltransferase 1